MSEIEALTRQIEQAQAVKEQRDRMVKLTSNRDFQKLIIEGFCRDEAARFVHLSTDPNLSVQDRADALGSAQAAGHLKRWINALIAMGNNASGAILDMEEALAELRAEETEA